jgi:lipopolysaccharide transport system ATP-binding protein
VIDSSSAVILVSHQETQILEICNRVLVMKEGSIIFDGDPQEAFTVYRSGEGHDLI